MTTATVASPCVKICELDADKVCIGCGRTLDEIAQWLHADDAQRLRIVEAARRRQPAFRRSPENLA